MGSFFSTKSGRYSAHIPDSNETDRVATYVQHKTTFKMRHLSRATHQARADRSPEKPHCGKYLVHVSSFGSAQAMRSAHLWFLQQQIHSDSTSFLLSSWNTQAQRLLHISMPDKRPQWFENCVLLQTWEDQELQRAEGKIGPSCEVHSLIFDCALVGSCERTLATDIYGCLDVNVYVRWALQAHTHYLQWKRFLADSDDPRVEWARHPQLHLTVAHEPRCARRCHISEPLRIYAVSVTMSTVHRTPT